MKCKHGNQSCGVHWTCGTCQQERDQAAWLRLTPAQREYDKYVTSPSYGRDDYALEGCSCHLSAPCSYCTRDVEDAP